MADPKHDFLIAKVREAVGDPVLPVVVTAFDREERIVVSAGGHDFSFDDKAIVLHFFWPVSFAHMARVVAEGLKAESTLDSRRKAPWPDFRGADIYEGDTIVHPQGDSGTVVFDASREPGLEWRVKYLDNGDSLWLGNQIGDKGQACVLAVKEGGNV